MLGNEKADRLAGSAQPTPGVQVLLDKHAVESIVETSLTAARDNPVSYTHLTLPTTPYV